MGRPRWPQRVRHPSRWNQGQVKGRGIGNAYFDLLPFGGRDALATIYAYDAIRRMARLEEQVAAHPEWNIPAGPLAFEPAGLVGLADEMKAAGEQFWNPATGRFVSAVDVDGRSYDYGFTFVNLEAIDYGFATDAQARDIMAWIADERMVDGDTSQGDDIYHWRFAPRCTTRRNTEYYGFVWTGPETIPFGGQVQDGGAVLGSNLPGDWPRLTVTRVDFHSMICNFTVANDGIRIDCKNGFRNQGEWFVRMLDADGKEISQSLETIAEGGCIALPESEAATIQLMAK